MSDELDLSALPASEPPEDFAERVLAARREERALPTGWRRSAQLAVALAAAIACALWLVRWPSEGTATAAARSTLALGSRGIAVAEAGAQLRWSIALGGAARVEQERGDVFYRVEPGGPFRVTAGDSTIEVTGTSFRVEVEPMPASSLSSSRSSTLGRLTAAAAAGAVVSAIAVTVYEGHVRVTSAGASVELGPGESTRAVPSSAPALTKTEPQLLATAPAMDAAQASRDELLHRDVESRAQIAALQTRVREMEGERAKLLAAVRARPNPDGAAPEDGMPPWDKVHDFTPAESKALAAKCELRIGVPQLERNAWSLSPDKGAALHLSDSEQALVSSTVNQLNQVAIARLRALYIEATGDAAGADSLEPANMGNEILLKSSRAQVNAAREKLSRELAGLQAPPADPNAGSIPERYYRLMLSLGDSLQQTLTPSLGAQQAAAARDALTSWRTASSGCP